MSKTYTQSSLLLAFAAATSFSVNNWEGESSHIKADGVTVDGPGEVYPLYLPEQSIKIDREGYAAVLYDDTDRVVQVRFMVEHPICANDLWLQEDA